MKIFRKFISAAAVCSMVVSAVPTASLAGEIYQFTDKEILASPVKPIITLESQVLTLDEVMWNNREVEVTINVEGADLQYSATGLRLNYDSRLSVKEDDNGYPEVTSGNAIGYLGAMFGIYNDSIFLATVGEADYGRDGRMWNITFVLPEDAEEGDVYTLDIAWESVDGVTADMFSNFKNDRDGQLMSAYASRYGTYGSAVDFQASYEDTEKCPNLAYVDYFIDGYIAVAGGYGNTTDSGILYGDANCDKQIDIADATAVVQSIGNKDEYALSSQGTLNADTNGDGVVTGADAIIIQKVVAGVYSADELPVK